MDRRRFLQLAGTTGAVAVGGCSRGGPSHVIAYVAPARDGVTPGISAEYATVCRECPAGCGMVARVRDGRCHKLEGNPDHPINRGTLCLRGQSALQSLYNPDRLRGPMAPLGRGGLGPISWEDAGRRLNDALTRSRGGRAVWIGGVETGAFDRLVDAWLGALFPTHTRIRYETFAYEPLRAAAARVFGAPAIPDMQIANARMLLSFGADFLETWVSNVQYARDFGDWRAARVAGRHRGRFVFLSPHLTLTGANADEWIRIRPGTEAVVARALAAVAGGGGDVGAAATAAGISAQTIQRIGREMAAQAPSLAFPLGTAGHDPQAADAEEAVLRLNVAVGAVGRTLTPGRPHALSSAGRSSDLLGLIPAMEAGQVAILFVHRANPAYSLPPSTRFAAALRRVPVVVSFSSFPDETTQLASLVLPGHTFLEEWGEYSPRPGITGLLQPVVGPVFDTRPVGDVLLQSAAALGSDLGARSQEEYLRKAHPMDDATWQATLQRGGVFAGTGIGTPAGATAGAGGAAAAAPPAPAPGTAHPGQPGASPAPLPAPRAGSVTLSLRTYPSLQLYDGRLANHPWAQEIPEPLSKAVWGSWAEIHPDTARRLQAQNEDLLRLETQAGHIEVPALVTERVHPDAVAVQLGQGHPAYGRYANGVGVNPLALLSGATEPASGALILSGVPVAVSRLPVVRRIVVLQTGRNPLETGIAQIADLAAVTSRPQDTHPPGPRGRTGKASLYASVKHPNHHWGLVIDLDRCIGCNACAAACYAENNVPVVGRDQCWRGREMSWLRIENYGGTAERAGEPGARVSDTRFLPMLCQQCDNAPCEYVCPVYATMHSDEGLNEQVYNRCVGTRYCSNNCPYKVRRFNWFTFPFPEPLNRHLNPEVIHRTKGVMEKCSFCIQRIRAHEIQAKSENRPIRDQEFQTACAQTCPTSAIVFGDFKDPNSKVSQLTRSTRGYGALEQLNTYPNIVYLARVRSV